VAARLDVLAAWLACLIAALPVASAGAEARVDVRDDRISATFEESPTPEVLAAIRQATGVEIVLPPSASARTVTLAVESVPFERFLQRLLDALELGGYMLVFEPGATAPRVIMVDRGSRVPPPVPAPVPGAPAPAAPGAPPEAVPGTPGAPAEPVPGAPPVAAPGVPAEPVPAPPVAAPGVPDQPVPAAPGTPPVYIPPGTPPTYVPPATPPVYIPPATPPVYIPPGSPPSIPPTSRPPAAPTQ
jgi:hypothetical protein